MTLYFFERITADDFVGPVIVAGAEVAAAVTVRARREGHSETPLPDHDWMVAQEGAAIPTRAGGVYPAGKSTTIRTDCPPPRGCKTASVNRVFGRRTARFDSVKLTTN